MLITEMFMRRWELFSLWDTGNVLYNTTYQTYVIFSFNTRDSIHFVRLRHPQQLSKTWFSKNNFEIAEKLLYVLFRTFFEFLCLNLDIKFLIIEINKNYCKIHYLRHFKSKFSPHAKKMGKWTHIFQH